ncbi:MAG: 4-hydroxythreonine-4-phosphate dehydrogenase PdxA, partial [Clostridia bacterium]|nr:4-hydroxythreonine-4-phosphate dehydrogenase PdxA [Deltaproteobacteria bacterium]
MLIARSHLQRLVVTLGDPAGVGPEVTEKALQLFCREEPDAAIILVGPSNSAEEMQTRLNLAQVSVFPLDRFDGRIGLPTAESGRLSLEALNAAIRMCKTDMADAIVTAPISKHALALAGSDDRGHTEILARQ